MFLGSMDFKFYTVYGGIHKKTLGYIHVIRYMFWGFTQGMMKYTRKTLGYIHVFVGSGF